MTGLAVARGDGTFISAKGIWIARGDGTLVPVKNAWIARGDGTFVPCWPTDFSGGVGNSSLFSVHKSYPSWVRIVFDYNAPNASKVQVRLAGTNTVVYEGGGGNGGYQYIGVPGGTYRFYARAFNNAGGFTDSQIVSITLDALPAPSNFRRTGGTSTGSYYMWDGVSEADTYEIVNTAVSGNPVIGTVDASATAYAEGGLTPNFTYGRAIRAKLGNARSALSSNYRYTTPAASTTAKGTYFFAPISMDVWSPGKNQWRGGAAGPIHGNGDSWGGGYGDNATFFFYDLAQLRALTGKVTQFVVRFKRDGAAGYSAPQQGRWWIHTYSSRPAGKPEYTDNAKIDAGAWSWNQDLLVQLPVAWGQAIIDDGYDSAGLVFGGVRPRYMKGPPTSTFPNQGAIGITLG